MAVKLKSPFATLAVRSQRYMNLTFYTAARDLLVTSGASNYIKSDIYGQPK